MSLYRDSAHIEVAGRVPIELQEKEKVKIDMRWVIQDEASQFRSERKENNVKYVNL